MGLVPPVVEYHGGEAKDNRATITIEDEGKMNYKGAKAKISKNGGDGSVIKTKSKKKKNRK